jgi:glycosyltransferase involved in cell wall biosynthesis
MRIVQILPGSGDNFYCENCVRDNALVRALIDAGQDVAAAPMYLPHLLEQVDAVSKAPVFYGGINAYLQQKSGFFRKTPRWLDRIFDSRWMLRIAARRAGSVRASGLGEMTLSVLRGEDGNQAKELGRLLQWLERSERPDVIHLSTSLLLGIGTAVKKRLDVPVVCSLQDEDVWIDAMEEPSRTQCWESMAEQARNVDAFVAVSRYFGDVMRERLQLDAAKLRVVHIGVSPGDPPSGRAPDPPAIGYLARMAESMGLGLLAEAFLTLKKSGRFPGLRLHLSGGQTADDAPFLEQLRRRFADQGVAVDVAFYEEFDPEGRRRFLDTLTLLSVPTPKGVAFGTYILEALARGVPVVQPREGSFPEIVEATGGGVLYAPNDADMLARALGDLLQDDSRRADLARRGRDSVTLSFSLDSMAQNMLAVYRSVLNV